jgi:hypothetical protein
MATRLLRTAVLLRQTLTLRMGFRTTVIRTTPFLWDQLILAEVDAGVGSVKRRDYISNFERRSAAVRRGWATKHQREDEEDEAQRLPVRMSPQAIHNQ